MAKTETSLDRGEVRTLSTLLEESARATKEPPRRFIEPAQGTLARAKLRRNHIVFGRRGSGKTSLLRQAFVDLSLDRIPVAFVDLETFKDHSYPDVLLSVLIQTLESFRDWLQSAGTNPVTKRKWWQRWFGSSPRKPPLPRRQVAEFQEALNKQVASLRNLLESTDGAVITHSTRAAVRAEDTAGAAASVTAAFAAGSIDSRAGITHEAEANRTESLARSKVDHLHRKIIDFQKLFTDLTALACGDAFVFLDDLYHIRRADQARVIDYFHRIAKNRAVWLKIGTIRHRTDWYRHGDPPVGLKLGDDCDEIDLDITLEKFTLAKEFLVKLLDGLMLECGLAEHGEILAREALDRLVLASGGVARDFLNILRRAIDFARERGNDSRGPKIGAEDVNGAAGENEPTKRDELRLDAREDRAALEFALSQIREFCLERHSNCLLVEQADGTREEQVVGELVDMRFLHVVRSRVTARDVKGKLFSAYMLDVSQYTGARKRRDLQMVEFWRTDELDKLRRKSHVLDGARLIRPTNGDSQF